MTLKIRITDVHEMTWWESFSFRWSVRLHIAWFYLTTGYPKRAWRYFWRRR